MDPLIGLRRACRHFWLPFAAALCLRLTLEPELAMRAPLLLALNLLVTAGVALIPRLGGTGPRAPRVQAGLLLILAINLGYQFSGRFMQAGQGWRADGLLHATDIALLGGHDVQHGLQLFNHAWFNDLLALSYAFFLLLLPLVGLHYVLRARPADLARYWLGLMTVYGFGFAGYFLLPAAGPYLHHAQSLDALRHGVVSGPIHAFIASQSTGVDVWPSLHCAVTLYIELWLLREAPRWGRALLLPTALVVLSTMALQYHYLIDVLCGIPLAIVAFWIAREKTA